MQLTTACTLLRGSSAIGGGDGIPDGKVLSCDFVGQGERVGLEYNGFFKGRSAGPRSIVAPGNVFSWASQLSKKELSDFLLGRGLGGLGAASTLGAEGLTFCSGRASLPAWALPVLPLAEPSFQPLWRRNLPPGGGVAVPCLNRLGEWRWLGLSDTCVQLSSPAPSSTYLVFLIPEPS